MAKSRLCTHPLYPWSKWLNPEQRNKTYKLVSGKDYNCFTHSMLSQIRNRATKQRKMGHDLRVKLEVFHSKTGEEFIKLTINPEE